MLREPGGVSSSVMPPSHPTESGGGGRHTNEIHNHQGVDSEDALCVERSKYVYVCVYICV